MPDFGRIISLAYMRILGRPPDPGGLDTYNRQMNMGMAEADMRESLLRSPEYAANNPDRAAPAKRSAASKRAIGRKKKSSRGKKKSTRKSR